MKGDRWHNFNAGPSALPVSVLERVQREMLCLPGTGCSILELSHRSKAFDDILQKTKHSFRSLLEVPGDYSILFMQGGGTGMTAACPLNLLKGTEEGAYAISGTWSQKAQKECIRMGFKTHILGKSTGASILPVEEWQRPSKQVGLVHTCWNETIAGLEYPSCAHAALQKADQQSDLLAAPWVLDASSNFCSRPVNVSRYSVIYAGAQKNAGAAGITVVIRRQGVGGGGRCPTLWDFDLTEKADSCLNTIPTFNVYLSGLVAEWVASSGGVTAMDQRAKRRSGLLYDICDNSDGFYRCPVEPSSRSRMNVCFNMKTEELQDKFISESVERGMIGLKGHRSVGGVRASVYNSVTDEAVEALADFMEEFKQTQENMPMT